MARNFILQLSPLGKTASGNDCAFEGWWFEVDRNLETSWRLDI